MEEGGGGTGKETGVGELSGCDGDEGEVDEERVKDVDDWYGVE